MGYRTARVASTCARERTLRTSSQQRGTWKSLPTSNEGAEVTLRKRLTTGTLALALAAGGALAVPAAANASQVWQGSGYTSKAQCLNAEAMARGIIVGGGGEIYAGDPCAYRGASLKWSYALRYH